MKQNQIMLVVAIGFIVMTISIALAYSSKVKPNVNALDIKVYKSHLDDRYESGHVYRECSVATDVLRSLVNEFNKSYQLTEENRVPNKQINGTYKLIYNDKFIAFDNADDNIVYLGSNDALYAFESTMYQKVIEYCG